MKTATDTAATKLISAFSLTFNGEHAGRIVVAWGRSGGTATASVWIHGGPLACSPSLHGSAGGYGYDKESAAVADAFNRWVKGRAEVAHWQTDTAKVPPPGIAAKVEEIARAHGAGWGAIESVLVALGYKVARIL